MMKKVILSYFLIISGALASAVPNGQQEDSPFINILKCILLGEMSTEWPNPQVYAQQVQRDKFCGSKATPILEQATRLESNGFKKADQTHFKKFLGRKTPKIVEKYSKLLEAIYQNPQGNHIETYQQSFPTEAAAYHKTMKKHEEKDAQRLNQLNGRLQGDSTVPAIEARPIEEVSSSDEDLPELVEVKEPDTPATQDSSASPVGQIIVQNPTLDSSSNDGPELPLPTYDELFAHNCALQTVNENLKRNYHELADKLAKAKKTIEEMKAQPKTTSEKAQKALITQSKNSTAENGDSESSRTLSLPHHTDELLRENLRLSQLNHEFSKKFETTSTDLTKAQETIKSLRSEIQSQKERQEKENEDKQKKLTTENQRLKKQYEESQDNIKTLQEVHIQKRDAWKKEKEDFQKKIQGTENQNKQHQQTIGKNKALNQRVTDLTKEKARLEQELATVRKEAEQSSQKLHKTQQAEMLSLRNQVNLLTATNTEMKKKQQQDENTARSLREEIKKLTETNTQFSQANTHLATEVHELKEALEKAQGDQTTLNQRIKDLTHQSDQLNLDAKNTVESHEQKMMNLTTENNQLKLQTTEWEKKYAALEQEMEKLKSSPSVQTRQQKQDNIPETSLPPQPSSRPSAMSIKKDIVPTRKPEEKSQVQIVKKPAPKPSGTQPFKNVPNSLDNKTVEDLQNKLSTLEQTIKTISKELTKVKNYQGADHDVLLDLQNRYYSNTQMYAQESYNPPYYYTSPGGTTYFYPYTFEYPFPFASQQRVNLTDLLPGLNPSDSQPQKFETQRLEDINRPRQNPAFKKPDENLGEKK